MQKMIGSFVSLFLCGLAWAEPAGLLVYQVKEEGIDPYLSRIIVTDDFVRMDEGESDKGFALYDRSLEIVYNVMPAEQSILVLNPQSPQPDDNPAIILQEKVVADPAAPKVAGHTPTEVTLLANGEVCAQMVVIKGPMADALEGLGELKLTLARVHAATAGTVPLNMQSACDQATNIYAADRALQFGLPLQERGQGRSQSLVDFAADYDADPSLFELPAGYARRPMIPGV